MIRDYVVGLLATSAVLSAAAFVGWHVWGLGVSIGWCAPESGLARCLGGMAMLALVLIVAAGLFLVPAAIGHAVLMKLGIKQ